MNIYFDESGNSGCILPNCKGELYPLNQRHFALCGVLTSNEEDEKILRKKYLDFKTKYNIEGELKGSDLLIKKNNHILLDFIENILDDSHFHVCCYDKKFYLATLVSDYILGPLVKIKWPEIYYTLASGLVLEDDSIFMKYCDAISTNTRESTQEFVEFISTFPFKYIPNTEINLYKKMAYVLLPEFSKIDYPQFFLPVGSYLKSNYTNIINLTSLGESLISIKINGYDRFQNVSIYHDHITEFELEFRDTFNSEFSQKLFADDICSLNFVDSQDELLVQLADNVSSVFRKAFSESIFLFQSPNRWENEHNWFPSLLAKLIFKLHLKNLKIVTSIDDNVGMRCIANLFHKDCPLEYRNNRNYSLLFQQFLVEFWEDLDTFSQKEIITEAFGEFY